MRNTLTVDGTNITSTWGVEISGYETYSAPKKSYKYYTIQKRNGLLASSNERFENITVRYRAGIARNFESNIENMRAFLLSRNGYVRITDSYHPNEFRLGIYEGPFAPEVSEMYDAAEFELEFNCKPQRFLTSGELTKTYNYSSSTSTLNNPTRFTAKPLIRIYGYGAFRVGDRKVTVTQHSRSYIDMDCESMDCYYSTYSMNSYVTVETTASTPLPTTDFPVLVAGNNSIGFYDSTLTKIVITPRWFTV